MNGTPRDTLDENDVQVAFRIYADVKHVLGSTMTAFWALMVFAWPKSWKREGVACLKTCTFRGMGRGSRYWMLKLHLILRNEREATDIIAIPAFLV